MARDVLWENPTLRTYIYSSKTTTHSHSNTAGSKKIQCLVARIRTAGELRKLSNPAPRNTFLFVPWCSFPPSLKTAKGQKALDPNPAKTTSAQQFPATVSRELGHDHDGDVLYVDTSLHQ